MRNQPLPLPTGWSLLSRTAEHALRATLFLARHAEAGFVPASVVAEALGTPPNYTSKTLRQLAQKGLLRSLRGPQGGFALAVEPSALSVAVLMDTVHEHAERPAVCLLGDRRCDEARPCAAHTRWMEVQEGTHAILERTTLADLLSDEATAAAR